MKRRVDSTDLGRLWDIGELCLSADGRFLAASVTRPLLEENRYARDVVVGAPGERLEELGNRFGDSGRHHPVFSHGSHVLAVVAAGEDASAVELFELDTGERAPSPLAHWPYPIEELAFSPDDRHLLFVSRVPSDPEWWLLPEDRRPPLRIGVLQAAEDGTGWTFNRPRQAFLVEVSGSSEPRPVSRAGMDEYHFAFHPGGGHVVFVSARHEGRDRSIVNDVFVAGLDGSEPRRLTDTSHHCAHPRCSPDGRRVSFLSVDVAGFPSVSEVMVVPFEGGDAVVATEGLDRDCNSPSSGSRGPIFLDDERVVALVDDSGAVDARSMWLTAGSIETLIPATERRLSSLAVSGQLAAFVESSPVTPPRLVVRHDAHERTCYAPNGQFSDEVVLVGPRHHRVETDDDVVVDSWLTLPDYARWRPPHPLLVCLQGGGTQFGWQFSHEFQLLTAEGFAVLYLNARGSAGYGNAWQRAVSGPDAAVPGSGWGTVDAADVEAVLDATLERESSLDPRRVGVQGGSYGGLVTAFLLARSKRFAAGWAERGPYDLVSLAGTNDESPWFFERYLGRSVVEDPGAYWQRSPLSLAAQITAPLLIVHSELDRRCPIQQAEELFMALKLCGRHVEMLRFPGEGHSLSRSGSPVHRLQRLDAMLEWFGSQLCPLPSS